MHQPREEEHRGAGRTLLTAPERPEACGDPLLNSEQGRARAQQPALEETASKHRIKRQQGMNSVSNTENYQG